MFNALRADNSPFTEKQIEQLRQSLGGLDAAQSVWLSGFISGRMAGNADSLSPIEQDQPGVAAQRVPDRETLQIFFASQTGNGEDIALGLAGEAEQAGLAVEVQSLASLRPAALKKLKYAVFIISTHGEGDPPDDAIDIFEYLESPRAAQLDDLKFRVLALGDRSYSEFCEAGRKLETLLLAKGAATFADRVECDIDYQSAALSFTQELVEFGLEHLLDDGEEMPTGQLQSATGHLSVVPQSSRWSKSNPFPATVEKVQKITGLESEKDVFHIELSLEDSGLNYQPGDALAVMAPNRHELVSEILNALEIEADEEIALDGHRHTVHELLARRRELTRLSPDTIKAYAELSGNETLQQDFDQFDDSQRREFIESRQFADLLNEYPLQPGFHIDATQLADLLRPLTSRSYSIASSSALVDEEVHLTVATLKSNAVGEERHGVASDFLNYRIEPGDEVSVFLEPNRRFRLPEDRDTPLIMVAAGTGVAPYRAFLQQLDAEGSKPDTWLIFGNPHLRTDFLYQREWLDWRSSGLLTRIDGAFSRDQEEKRYVQHVLREQSERLQSWLEKGAKIYICGSLAMGREVELTLRDSLAERLGLTTEQAAEQVADLRRQGRLLKDLY